MVRREWEPALTVSAASASRAIWRPTCAVHLASCKVQYFLVNKFYCEDFVEGAEEEDSPACSIVLLFHCVPIPVAIREGSYFCFSISKDNNDAWCDFPVCGLIQIVEVCI